MRARGRLNYSNYGHYFSAAGARSKDSRCSGRFTRARVLAISSALFRKSENEREREREREKDTEDHRRPFRQ